MALAPMLMRLAGTFVIQRALDEVDLPGEEQPIDIPVSSTAIAAIGWHPDDETISVTFHRGGTYTYAGTKDLFEAFAAAPSKGQFFNQYLRR